MHSCYVNYTPWRFCVQPEGSFDDEEGYRLVLEDKEEDEEDEDEDEYEDVDVEDEDAHEDTED